MYDNVLALWYEKVTLIVGTGVLVGGEENPLKPLLTHLLKYIRAPYVVCEYLR